MMGAKIKKKLEYVIQHYSLRLRDNSVHGIQRVLISGCVFLALVGLNFFEVFCLLFLSRYYTFHVLQQQNLPSVYPEAYTTHLAKKKRLRFVSFGGVTAIVTAVVATHMITSIIFYRTLAANPTFSGTIPNISLTEDTTTNNTVDLDNYFTPVTGTCTYSAVDEFDNGTMTLDVDGTVDFSSTATSGGYIKPNSPTTVLLLHGDDTNASTTMMDTGARGYTPSVNGNVQIATAQSKFGGSSIYFDGSGDYLSLPSNSDFALGTTFTVEAFIYPTALQALNYGAWITDFRGGSTNNWTLGTINSAGSLKPYAYANGTGYTGTTAISLNAWHHLAYVYTGNVMTLYVDGVASGTLNMTYSQPATSLIMGARYSADQEFVTGYMDDIRITKDVALYTGAFTPSATTFDDVAFTSRIIDAGSSTVWNTLGWKSFFPASKLLPNNAGIETIYNSGNADMSNNVLLLHMDDTSGNIVDGSGNNHNATVNGGVSYATAAKLNTGLTFNGSTGYLSIADHADWTLGSSNFTVETWAKFNTVGNAIFIGHDNGGGNTNKWLFMYESGNVKFLINPGALYPINYAWSPVVGQWYHLAVTRSGSTYTLYIDGVSVATGSNASAIPDPTASLTIGQGEGIYYLNGALDELALLKRALSATEVLDTYKRGAVKIKYQVRSCDDAACSGESFVGPGTVTTTSNTSTDFGTESSYVQQDATNGTDFSSGTARLTQLGSNTIKSLLHLDNVLTDYGAYVPKWTASNLSYNASGKFSHSAIFNGSNAVITTPETTGTDWDLGTTYTIEFWVKPYYTNSLGRIISTRGGSGTDGWEIYTGGCTGTPCRGTLGMSHGQNSGTSVISATTVLTKDVWNHVAITGDGTTRRLFVNGTIVASGGVVNVLGSSINQPLTIGRSANAAYGEWFPGEIDEFTVLKGEARYTTNFTAPTAPYNGEGNTKLLLHADGTNGSTTITDESITARTVTVAGNASISTVQNKFGGSAISLDGTGDYLSVGSSSDFALGSTFTAESFVYPTGMSADGYGSYLFDFRGSSANNWVLGMINSGGALKMYACGNLSGCVTGTITVSLNTWHHLAYVYSGNVITIYLDGVLDGTLSKTFSQAASSLIIGAKSTGAQEYITGYLDDIRITKGIARYTENFTPSVSAFTDNSGYPTSQAYYVTTAEATSFSLANINEINSITVTNTQPTNTTIKALVSFDGRSTWKYYSGGSFATASGGLTDLQTSGMTIAELQTAFTNWNPAGNATLDFAFDLKTTDRLATPNVDLVTINYDQIANPAVTYYSELSNSAVGLPAAISIGNGITANRYFQYKAFLQTENASYAPLVHRFSTTAGTGTYTDQGNGVSAFGGGTHASTVWTKPSTDTVKFQCTNGDTASVSSNSVIVYYPVAAFTSTQTGNWNVGTTWGGSCTSSCFEGVDYPGLTSAATIASGHVVTVPAATTASFTTLAVTGSLTLTGNIGTGTNITVNSGGTVTQNNLVQQSLSGALTVNSGGTLTHTANTTALSYSINFSVGSASIAGTINGAAKGFQETAGTGAGNGASSPSNGAGGGGAYGGYGGDASTGGGIKSVGYGSAILPVDIGSGGGNGYGGIAGGDGGGLVQLTVGGNLTVDTGGVITATGGNGTTGGSGYAGGGGSGGSIYMNVTGNISASGGSITANGGNGGNNSQDGGGGGGGRIALVYQGTYTAPTTLSAFAGTSTGSASPGGAGSVFVDGPSSAGILTYDANNNGSTIGSNLSTVSNVTYTISELVVKNGANFLLPAGSTLTTGQTTFNSVGNATQTTISGTFNPGNTTFTFPANLTVAFASGATLATVTTPTIDGAVTINSGMTESFSDVTIGSTGTLTLQSYTSTPLTINSLVVNGTLTHSNNTTVVSHLLNIQTTGNITVGIAGSITAVGKGFQTTSGTGEGNDHSGTTSGGGAAYGGYGGAASTGGGQKSVGYGSIVAPTDLGSGGGQGYGSIAGGAGGGGIQLTVGGDLTINSGGSITANGSNGTTGGSGYAGGGGSGGSIYLNVTGNVSASGANITTNGGNGGDNSQDGGGGGGGRIALINQGTYNTSGAVITAYGGTSTGSAVDGGAGSIFIDTASDTGSITYDNNNSVDAIGSSLNTVGSVSHSITELVIKNSANLTIPAGSTITSNQTTFNNVGSAATFIIDGIFNPSNTNFTFPANLATTLSSSSTLSTVTNATVDGNFTLTAGATESINDATINSGGTVTMASFTNASTAWSLTGGLTVNGTLTHTANSSSTLAHKIKLTATTVTVGSTGSINVDGKGYPKATGSSGTNIASGAGQNATGLAGGQSDSGSGAGHGGTGGNSGGTAISGAAAYDTASAPIDLGAGGGNGYSGTAGGAGGGAVEINTTTSFTLNGAVTADGANGGTVNGYGHGGGAGGSIYITAPTLSGSGSMTATGGVGGNAGDKAGGGGGGRTAIVGLTGSNNFSGTHTEAGGSATSPATAGAVGTYYEGNITPAVAISSATQQTNDGYVNINYTITDGNTDQQTLNIYEYSTDNSSWSTMTAATGDAEHQGVSGLNSSAAGTAHTFVWNTCSNIAGTYDATVYVRLRSNDGTVNSATSTSSAFAVDCAAPSVSSVTAAQNNGAGTVAFGYTLADDTTTNLSVALDIDNSGGSGGWSVTDSTVSGNVGSAQNSGSGKIITWTASADASGVESITYQVRLRATDQYQNVGSYAQSSNFALDTKDPAGLAALAMTSREADRITLGWTAVSSETNFDHYEIWYGTTTNQADNRTGTEWDNSDDAALLTMATTSTTITGLTPATTYYFKIWAVDDYGHEITIARINAATTGVIPNTPTATSPTNNQAGLAGTPTLTASSYGSTINSTHLSTEWQISDDGTFSDDCSDTNIVWCKLNDTTNKTGIIVNATNGTFQNALANKIRLTQNSFYYCRFRYISDTGGQSNWSVARRFGIGNDVPTYVSLPNAQQRSVNLGEDGGAVTSFDLDDLFADTGDTCSYAIVDNPTPNISAVINNSTNVVTLTPAVNYNGSDNIIFRCTDSQGASVDSENIALTVSGVNDAPTGSAGSDVTIPLDQNEIRLSGAGSDVEGDTLTYSWEIIEDGSHLGGCGLQDFNSATPLLQILERIASGYTCTIRLTISDGSTSITDDIIIIVASSGTQTDSTPLPSVAATSGQQIILDLDDYFDPPADEVYTYEATGQEVIEVIITGSQAEIIIPADFAGTEVIVFTALDEAGNVVDTNDLVLTVEPPNESDTVVCGTKVLNDIAQVRGNTHGIGKIKVQNGDGNTLRSWRAFHEAGVVPRLVTINGEYRIFALKYRSGTSIHVYDACGNLIRKQRLSPKLHWRRFAMGNVDRKSKTREIVVATEHNGFIDVKVLRFSTAKHRPRFIVRQRARFAYSRNAKSYGDYSVRIKDRTIQLIKPNKKPLAQWQPWK